MLEQLSERIGGSIPFACQDWAATKAAYRFFSNARISEDKILAGHFLCTRERFASVRGTRAMVTLIRMGREFGYEKLRAAVEKTLDLGCEDVARDPPSAHVRSVAAHGRRADRDRRTIRLRTPSANHDRVRPAVLRHRAGGAGMSLPTASISQNCKALRLPAVGAQFASLAEEAGQRNHSHLHYLEALLQSEMEDRERRSIELRMKEAHLPRIKTLEEFDFAQSPHIPAPRIRALAEGGYLERAEPVLLVGDPGTGKSHCQRPSHRGLSSTSASAVYDCRCAGQPTR